ncbi:hypothetical protein JTE90_004684 [Oedothorax gibbosus]|uniref:Eukaryotic translation initiation factor 3 subunit K n=1 Tax=Oedothorax gibbosus TaxID=931172 RepID=A0AAV6UAZ2_9ARAC|nr:hypothetical protein JTE90_004684 [Oedothorax gibbosus]
MALEKCRENTYDLEANLAVLKLYQFNPTYYVTNVVSLILLKALTNLPHADFVLCKCLIEKDHLEKKDIQHIVYLHDLLETCQFTKFWDKEVQQEVGPIIMQVTGFEDSIRKFICHVVNTTYQIIDKMTLSAFLGGLNDYALRGWMAKYGWKECGQNFVYIGNQEESIKTKNITEKIDFDSVAAIMSLTR